MLAIQDSSSSQMLIRQLGLHGLHPDFVIFWRSDARQSVARAKTLFRTNGLAAVMRAVVFALWARMKAFFQAGGQTQKPYAEFFVPHHNSKECVEILSSERPDILIISTNSILKPAVLSLPACVTLNAHPAWLPTYRGMGSSHYQLKAGQHLAVSVHGVDAGVDSGPIYAREYLRLDLSGGLPEVRRQLFGLKPELHSLMARLLVRVVQEVRAGGARPIDVSGEEGHLYRGGMPAHELKELDRFLRDPKTKLEIRDPQKA